MFQFAFVLLKISKIKDPFISQNTQNFIILKLKKKNFKRTHIFIFASELLLFYCNKTTTTTTTVLTTTIFSTIYSKFWFIFKRVFSTNNDRLSDEKSSIPAAAEYYSFLFLPRTINRNIGNFFFFLSIMSSIRITLKEHKLWRNNNKSWHRFTLKYLNIYRTIQLEQYHKNYKISWRSK